MKARDPRSLFSEANVVTLVRLTACLVLFSLAAAKNRELYNYIGLAVHWAGDTLDGWLARTFRQETILGAEADIIADRVEVLFFFVNFVHFHPALAVAVAAYILDFAFADFYLSYQFVKYDIISINYFDRVDRRVYALNFSPLGKLANSVPVVLVLIFLPKLWPAALVLALGLVGVKAYSISILWRRRAAGVRVPG